jgi:plastocyanin
LRSVYRWWVFVHLVGVFGFLVAHGVSVSVTFRLRKERDPRRVTELLALSGSSIRAFYASTFVLLLGGAVAGFLGHWWSQGWIWASLVVLVVTSLAMVFMARPFYRRVGFVARSMAGGSKAVSAAQFDTILGSRRPWTIAAIGFVGLLLILYLMLFKPTLGFGSSPASPQPVVTGSPAATLRISAKGVAFSTSSLSAPASLRFDIAFANQDPGIPHDVAIYTNPSAATLLFRGTTFPGVRTVTYRIPPLPPGTYFFRCDVHPAQMTGTIVVK